MAIRKWAKITRWIGGFVSVMVLLAGLGTYCCYKIDLHTGFIRRNPKKMIARMERIFAIDFPENITDVRAATAWMQWENWTTYIIKFRVDPNALDTFIKMEELSAYDANDDGRLEPDILPDPKWYREPIQQGRMGTLALDCPRDNDAAYKAELYIDTSDDTSFVVYIGGSYDNILHKLAR